MASKKVVHVTVDNNRVGVISLPMGIELIVTHLNSGFSSDRGKFTYKRIKEWDEDIEDYCYPIVSKRIDDDKFYC
jgi:hypothetical protein